MSKNSVLIVEACLSTHHKHVAPRFEGRVVGDGDSPNPQQAVRIDYVQLNDYQYHMNYSDGDYLVNKFPNLHKHFEIVRSKTAHGENILYARIDFKVTPVMQEVLNCVTQPLRNQISSMTKRHTNELYEKELMWSKCNEELNELSVKYFHLHQARQSWFYKLGSFLGLI